MEPQDSPTDLAAMLACRGDLGEDLLRNLRTMYRITASQTARPASTEGSKVSPPTRTEVLSR